MTDHLGLNVRSESEQDAYMAGQRDALKLAREKGIEYADEIISRSQHLILENRDEIGGVIEDNAEPIFDPAKRIVGDAWRSTTERPR